MSLLGRHVLRGADNATGDSQTLSRKDLSDSEIRQFDDAIGANQQVGRFEIPMNDSSRVRGFQCGADLNRDIDRLVPGKSSFSKDALGERSPFYVLHCKVNLVGVGIASAFEQLHDVRAGQLPHSIDFSLEAVGRARFTSH